MKHYDFRPLPGLAVRDAIGKVYRVKKNKDATVTVEVKRALGDNLLEVIRLDTGAPYQIIDPETNVAKLPCGIWLEEGLSSGEIEEVSIFATRISNYDEVLSQQDAKTFDPMSEARWLVMRDIAVNGVSRNDPKLGNVISESWERHNLEERFGKRPETRTIRSLMEKHDPAIVTMGQLISLSGKVPRAKRIDPEASEILIAKCDAHYNERGTRNCDTIAAIAAEIRARNIGRKTIGLTLLSEPCRETVRRMIGAMCTRERYERKWGKQAAERNWDGSGKGFAVHAIGELGMMDDTTLDTIVCFDMRSGLPAGRPNICVLIDIATRCIVGYYISFEEPTAFTALTTVRKANGLKDIPPSKLERYPVLRRINCAFSEILVDNGANYASRAFLDGMADIGTTVTLARVKRGRDKNFGERFFFTLMTLLLEKLPGFTANPKLLRVFGYNPEKDAALTISELKEVIELAIYVYHITLHTGIGMPPALKWQQLLETGGRRLIRNLTEFDVLTHETIWDLTLHRSGFVRNGLRYSHPVHGPELLGAAGSQRVGLIPNGTKPENAVDYAETTLDGSDQVEHRKARHRKTKSADLRDEQSTIVVKGKRNRANLGTIYLQHPRTKEYLPFPAVHEEYVEGLSLRQHEAVQAYAKKANLAFNTETEQILARHELNEYIRELAPSLDARERKALARIAEKSLIAPITVEETFADARHDGMAGVSSIELPAKHRHDASQKPTRPTRGGIYGATGSAGKMPDENDGDQPFPERTPPTAKQRAAAAAIGKAAIEDDQKWEEFA